MKYLKRLLSFVTGKKIPIGAGVSFDSDIEFKEVPTKEQIESAQRVGKASYVLRDDVGSFEMEGMVRRGDDKVYRLKHTLTGTVLTLPEGLFNLMFINQNRK